MATRLFLRLYLDDETWLGPGKVQLLEQVGRTGSISAAGRAMGMSYRRAWLLVEAVNGMFDRPVVTTQLGGRGGGAAVLTPWGRELIERYRRLEQAAARAGSREIAALQRRRRRSRAGAPGRGDAAR
ncbi:MAG: winged helix-turn-helix domain-containing protein [Steroidobacteraceae bacterium]|jgi:molybdate transport system regulatory protein|nr:winged helix-turn-helix domain-containing protein [Steroidobacteraceae bacterium]